MKNKGFEYFFFAVALAETFIQLSGRLEWNLLIKPWIVLSIGVFYFRNTHAKNYWFVGALLFCWLGDLFLLFDQVKEFFFIAGLGSFLVAHVLFIILYGKLKTVKGEGLNGPQMARATFPIILAGTGLIVVLYPALGDLKIPVIVYALALMVMVLRALYRYGFTSTQSFWTVTAGALLFMISDSLLAINKFFQPVFQAGVFIMITYMAAVYFIAKGVMAHREK